MDLLYRQGFTVLMTFPLPPMCVFQIAPALLYPRELQPGTGRNPVRFRKCLSSFNILKAESKEPEEMDGLGET